MLSTVTEIHWQDPLIAVPAFLTLMLIPLTYSIANGLGFGIIAWAVLHLATGKFRRQDWLLYVLAALFLARFIYLERARRPANIGFANRKEIMHWYQYLAYFFGGAFLANTLPHLGNGISGRSFQSPSHRRREKAYPPRRSMFCGAFSILPSLTC